MLFLEKAHFECTERLAWLWFTKPSFDEIYVYDCYAQKWLGITEKEYVNPIILSAFPRYGVGDLFEAELEELNPDFENVLIDFKSHIQYNLRMLTKGIEILESWTEPEGDFIGGEYFISPEGVSVVGRVAWAKGCVVAPIEGIETEVVEYTEALRRARELISYKSKIDFRSSVSESDAKRYGLYKTSIIYCKKYIDMYSRVLEAFDKCELTKWGKISQDPDAPWNENLVKPNEE